MAGLLLQGRIGNGLLSWGHWSRDSSEGQGGAMWKFIRRVYRAEVRQSANALMEECSSDEKSLTCAHIQKFPQMTLNNCFTKWHHLS